jgi:hypothetical protein
MSNDLAPRRDLVKLYRGFAAQDPAQRPELAAALQDLADAAQGAGLLDEALTCIREARQIYQDRVREGYADDIHLANCLNREANWLADAGDAQAESVFADEGAVYLSLAKTFPADRLLSLVSVLQPILDQNMSAGRYRSAENAARACIEVARRAAEQDPQAEAYLASSYTSLAASLRYQGRFAEALPEASRSAQIARRVAAMNMPDFDQTVLVTALRLVELLAKECGRPEEARAAQLEIRAQRSAPPGPG